MLQSLPFGFTPDRGKIRAHLFLSEMSEIPKRAARVFIGSDQTRSYGAFRESRSAMRDSSNQFSDEDANISALAFPDPSAIEQLKAAARPVLFTASASHTSVSSVTRGKQNSRIQVMTDGIPRWRAPLWYRPCTVGRQAV